MTAPWWAPVAGGLDPRRRAVLNSCEPVEDPPGTTTLVFKSRLLADKVLQLFPEPVLSELVRRAVGYQAARVVRVSPGSSLAESLFGKAVGA